MRSSASVTRPIVWGACLHLIAVLFPLSHAGVPALSFELRLKDETRTATVTPVQEAGVVRLPLSNLTRQLGGGCRIIHGRVQVDFVGKTAWIGLNQTEVSASLGQFSLQHPVVRRNGDALIALADVQAFFKEAFRLAIQQVTLPGAQTPRPGLPGPRIQVRELTEPGTETPRVAEQRPPEYATTPRVGVIIVDAGHGGTDVGVEGRAGLKEKDLALAVAHKVRRAIEDSLPVQVMLTRQDDQDIGLLERATFANRSGGGLFVSIHAGASYAAAAHGFEVFYTGSRPAAESMEQAVLAPVGQPWIEADDPLYSRQVAECVADALARETGAELRGIHDVPLRILKEVSMPGLLVELGCLTNPAEEALLAAEVHQEQLARGVAAGITAYITGKERAEYNP